MKGVAVSIGPATLCWGLLRQLGRPRRVRRRTRWTGRVAPRLLRNGGERGGDHAGWWVPRAVGIRAGQRPPDSMRPHVQSHQRRPL